MLLRHPEYWTFLLWYKLCYAQAGTGGRAMRGHVCLATPSACGSSGGFAPVTERYKAFTFLYK